MGETTIELYKTAADEGDVDAMVNYALRNKEKFENIRNGITTEERKEAEEEFKKYIKKAIKKKNSNEINNSDKKNISIAMSIYGEYLLKKDKKENIEKAKEYFKEALLVDKTNMDAINGLRQSLKSSIESNLYNNYNSTVEKEDLNEQDLNEITNNLEINNEKKEEISEGINKIKEARDIFELTRERLYLLDTLISLKNSNEINNQNKDQNIELM